MGKVTAAVSVEFRVLGDLEVLIDGAPVEVGHARQRYVLVALLVDAGRPVSADRLLERVWGDRLPQHARTALAGYLSRLRRVLRDAPEVGIRRRPGGYVLAVDPLAVDLHRFRHLVAAARETTDDRAAAGVFDRALRLWRGPAFAPLDAPWCDAARLALESERLAAELDRNELMLALGEHAAVVGALLGTADRYPLDERAAGQLMLALYRCGRQADALRRFAELRAALADELGADPGPALRELHRRILTSDPAIGATAAAPARAALPVPRQLPALPRAFTGRGGELARLSALLDAGQRDSRRDSQRDSQPAGRPEGTVMVAAVSGTAGVGKSALAVQWAHSVAGGFPDGQLFVNLRGYHPGGAAMTPAEALRGFLDAFAVPAGRIPAGIDAQAGLYRSLLAGRRVLVVLDNARDAGQVRPLLPGSPGCAAVVTSRDELAGLVAVDGAEPLRLGLLTDAEAGGLLARRIGAARVAAEPAAVREIVRRCAGLPLALSIVAGRAVGRPAAALTALARDLCETRRRLDGFASTDPAIDVRAVLSCSYSVLSPPAARLFRLLGVHPGPDVGARAAAGLAAEPLDRTRLLLAELATANLITEHRGGRYLLHDLLRAYAAERATGPDREEGGGRLLDHYLHSAFRADRLLYPYREGIALAPAGAGVTPEECADQAAALAWFVAEHQVLLGVLAWADGCGADRQTWQLAWAVSTYLNLQGQWQAQVAVQEVALAAAGRQGDRSGQAHAHRTLGRAHFMLGRDEEAGTNLRRALALFEALGDRAGQATTHVNLARLHQRLGDTGAELRHDRLSLALFEAVDDRAGQARALNNIGLALARGGRLPDALAACDRAVRLNQEIGNRHGEAAAWDSIGTVHGLLGRPDQAAVCCQRGLDLYRRTGDRPAQAASLIRLGDARLDAGSPDQARDAWRQALHILDELGHDNDEARTRLDAA